MSVILTQGLKLNVTLTGPKPQV